tara:strand:- start:56 stop:217 length:162 start_codon:yes stop_codon:yes gene_type:complete
LQRGNAILLETLHTPQINGIAWNKLFRVPTATSHSRSADEQIDEAQIRQSQLP